MAFAEDLSQFFDTDDFAVPASFSLKAGGTRSVNVIFNSPTQGVQIYDTTIESEVPFLTCKTTDLAGVAHKGGNVTVEGKSYTVGKIVDEGTGTSSVYLS